METLLHKWMYRGLRWRGGGINDKGSNEKARTRRAVAGSPGLPVETHGAGPERGWPFSRSTLMRSGDLAAVGRRGPPPPPPRCRTARHLHAASGSGSIRGGPRARPSWDRPLTSRSRLAPPRQRPAPRGRHAPPARARGPPTGRVRPPLGRHLTVTHRYRELPYEGFIPALTGPLQGRAPRRPVNGRPLRTAMRCRAGKPRVPRQAEAERLPPPQHPRRRRRSRLLPQLRPEAGAGLEVLPGVRDEDRVGFRVTIPPHLRRCIRVELAAARVHP